MTTRPYDVVWVDGHDAPSFLQGLLSNDVEALAVGDDHVSLLLDATGHIRFVLRVARTAVTDFTLIVDAGIGTQLASVLDEYHFSEDVSIIGPESVEVVTVPAPVAPDVGDLQLAGLVPQTIDIVGDGALLPEDVRERALSPDEWELLRIVAGVPTMDRDISQRTLVQEAGLDTRAVSFNKGCYLGQETVARIAHRGGVRRRLRGLRLTGPVTEDTPVTVDDRVIGSITSVATHPTLGAIGIGVIRTEAATGARVDTPQGAVIVDLPFETPEPSL